MQIYSSFTVKIFIENPCDKSERFDTINLLMPEFQIAKT